MQLAKEVKWLVSKETLCCVGGQVKQPVDYQLEVDKGKLTDVAKEVVCCKDIQSLACLLKSEFPLNIYFMSCHLFMLFSGQSRATLVMSFQFIWLRLITNIQCIII